MAPVNSKRCVNPPRKTTQRQLQQHQEVLQVRNIYPCLMLGINDENLKALAKARADTLLSAIVGFMQPMVPNLNMDVGATINTTPEGKALVRALSNFILMIVNPQPSQVQTSSEPGSKLSVPVTIKEPIQSKIELPLDADISQKILDKARIQVMNKMPIRLLMFDSNGGNVKITTRFDVIEDIRSRATQAATDEKFKADWEACEEDPDLRAGWRRQDELIDKLVKHHARYAILSHKWLQGKPGEVVYQGWDKRESNPEGYNKVRKFCEIAAVQYGVSYGWMDTACIDKTSSTELDESIRSMYKWYRYAYVCIAYMADTTKLDDMQSDSWFSRGWTLQELLAPKNIQFYNKNWKGFTQTQIDSPEPLPLFSSQSKMQDSVLEQIADGSGISRKELAFCQRGQVEMVSISRKFQLAARRTVTVKEDEVYSLMGLLGVDMSVAYGEGPERALHRLQRELLNTKKNVLDIFNCSYGSDTDSELSASREIQSLPTSIAQYLERSTAFDPPESVNNYASFLDIWRPVQALSSTHLGVYVPLLLVPALLEQPEGGYSPKASFSGQCIMNDSEAQYNLFDYRLYEDAQDIDTQSSNGVPSIIFFAVLNFTIDNGIVRVPQRCLGIPLHCGGMKPGYVRQSDNIKIVATKSAPVFAIDSDGNKYLIPQKKLGDQGMQFVTLYV